jgi:hypothetical protein
MTPRGAGKRQTVNGAAVGPLVATWTVGGGGAACLRRDS